MEVRSVKCCGTYCRSSIGRSRSLGVLIPGGRTYHSKFTSKMNEEG